MNDRDLIDRIGPAKLASALGFDKKRGGVQRVFNWRTRGIPPAVKLQHADTLRKLTDAAAMDSASAEGARDAA